MQFGFCLLPQAKRSSNLQHTVVKQAERRYSLHDFISQIMTVESLGIFTRETRFHLETLNPER